MDGYRDEEERHPPTAHRLLFDAFLSLNRLLRMHILFWLGLTVAAFATAGPYTFASCWGLILAYVPPAGILLLAIAAFSSIVLLASVAISAMRTSLSFSVARHGMILIAGLIACSAAAYAAAGQVNCL